MHVVHVRMCNYVNYVPYLANELDIGRPIM